jgi:hypothetical protein
VPEVAGAEVLDMTILAMVEMSCCNRSDVLVLTNMARGKVVSGVD